MSDICETCNGHGYIVSRSFGPADDTGRSTNIQDTNLLCPECDGPVPVRVYHNTRAAAIGAIEPLEATHDA